MPILAAVTPLTWFIAGGLAALVFERTAYRWLRRRWLWVVGGAFAVAATLAFGNPGKAADLLAGFSQRPWLPF